MKTLTDKNFIDWFSEHFGYGYGTGESYIVPVLKKFLENCDENGNYDHLKLEEKIGQANTWFLINVLCKSDLIEYGTSPRFGWLDESGKLLKEYIGKKSEDELYKLIMVDNDYVYCDSTCCNCGESGYVEGKKCDNPLF